MTKRAAYAVAWAVLCALVLSRVAVGFERIRFRVVTSPVPEQGRSIVVPLPDLSRLSGQTAAIILRFQGAAAPALIQLALDGAAISEITVPASRERRVDESARLSGSVNHQLALTSSTGGWQLTYLEIANVHGHSSGAIGLAIVPRDLGRFEHVPVWWLWPFVLGLLMGRRAPGWPAPRLARRLYVAGVALVLVLFVATLVVDRLTPFKVLLSASTFLWCVAIVHANLVAALVRLLWTTAKASAPTVRGFLRGSSRRLSTAARLPHLPAMVAGGASIAVFIAALALGNHIAGGADAYGYVSQSALWARGQLYIDQPIAADLPDYVDDWAIAPLGFVPQRHAGVRGRIVPYFSPGLPILMAPLRVFGADAVYLVVPLLAGLAVWLTFVVGRQLEGPATGVVAALWLAVSPAFLESAFAPMSDVPAMTMWLAAVTASLRPGWMAALAAGMATSVAILVRPNLFPLGAVIALPFLIRWIAPPRKWRPHGIETAVFAASAAIGPLAAAMIFNQLFGSPFQSGYGSLAMNVDWANVIPNLQRYPRWLIESQTPVIAASVAAPFLLWHRRPSNSGMSPRSMSLLLLAGSAIVWLSYLLYFQFDSWSYLRFLLPSYPWLIALASAVIVTSARRLLPMWRLALAIGVASLLLSELRFDSRHSLLSSSSGEARYRTVGEDVARTMPPNALLLSAQHSGSLRYYSGRTTLRYDQVPADRLDALVRHLQERGYPVFVVLDSWEIDAFRKRFASQREVGSLGWTPAAILHGSTDVKVYDLRDRTRQGPIETRSIR